MQVLFMLVRSSPSRATDSQVASAGRIWCGREQHCWLAQSATASIQSIEGPPGFRPPAVGAGSPNVAAISLRLYLAWLLNAAAADRSLPLRRAAHRPHRTYRVTVVRVSRDATAPVTIRQDWSSRPAAIRK